MIDRFAHHLRLDHIRDGERLDLVADDTERENVAKRLDLQSIERLEAHVTLFKNGLIVLAEGRLVAAVGQNCVVTGEPLSSHVDEPFRIQFMPEPAGGDEEIELAESDCDTVFYENGILDLGSAVGDSLALCLDPYPRSKGADAALKEAGVLTEEQASPFSVLARLKTSDSEQP